MPNLLSVLEELRARAQHFDDGASFLLPVAAAAKVPRPNVGNSELIWASSPCRTNSSKARAQIFTERLGVLVRSRLNDFTVVFGRGRIQSNHKLTARISGAVPITEENMPLSF
jgi:hypothetical protein